MITKAFAWIFFTWTAFAAVSPSAAYALRDLNAMSQDYVLETKRLIIPDYPTALNPSITRWKEKILLCFRIRDPITAATDRIGLVWLNNEMDPIGRPTVLNRPSSAFSAHPWPQDPRLLVIDDILYIVYSDLVNTDLGEVRRMFVSHLTYDGEQFYMEDPEYFLRYEEELKKPQEKNWVPFDYAGTLLLSYSVIPHRIFLPVIGKNQCTTVAVTGSKIPWAWGEVRGGTPALRLGDEYLAFFHSLKGMSTVQSEGKNITHYFMAAYTFEPDPPFRIKSMSPVPIMHPSFYDGPSYQTWKPLRAVYPSGYLIDGDYLWVAYGKQDHELWVAKLDKNQLLDSLIPVKSDD